MTWMPDTRAANAAKPLATAQRRARSSKGDQGGTPRLILQFDHHRTLEENSSSIVELSLLIAGAGNAACDSAEQKERRR